MNFPENGSVGRPNGLENTPRGCTIHSEEVWARGEPWRPILLHVLCFFTSMELGLQAIFEIFTKK